MALAVDGLISGLNTTELINSLMKLEAIPQNLLKARVSGTQDRITALQGLNSKIAALAELASKAAKPTSLDLYKATSSSADVSAAVTSGAGSGRINVVVTTLAQAHVAVSAAISAWPDDPPVLTIVGSDGSHIQVTATSISLDDVAAAINGAEAGVSAMKIAAGDGTFRLQFTATETGEAGAFEVYRGTSADVTAGTATDVLDPATGAAVITQASDAVITLWAGTTAEQTISSSTNTFTNLLPGVDVTVKDTSTDPVTITVARDDAAISKIAEAFVTALNEVFAIISTKSAVTNSTDASGNPVISSGVFTGDTSVQSINQRVLSAASLPVDGHSPSEIGISITKTGTIEFDAEKFAKALADDPANVATVVQELGSRVADVSAQISDKYDGEITSRITGQESMVDSLGDQISDWDRRLESRRSSLERIYASLEVQLSNLQSQGSWLTSQLGSLNPSA